MAQPSYATERLCPITYVCPKMGRLDPQCRNGGGLTFGQGLDEAGDKEEIRDVWLTILGRATVDRLWRDFTGPRPKYTRERDGEVVVTGRRLVEFVSRSPPPS